MTRDVVEAVAGYPDRERPVVTAEDGQVWVSGMNARPWELAEGLQEHFESEGIETGDVTDDGAAEHGGLLIEVPACEEVSEDVYAEVFQDGE